MKTFAGIDQQYADYDKARIVILPVPYDGTSTWVKGSDKGPAALFDAAENMELYDIETKSEVYKQGIHLLPALGSFSSPEEMRNFVYERVSSEFSKGKFPVLIGGEHSVSIGSIQACAEAYNNLTVVQIDAHADLREEYQGSKYNHACAMHWAALNLNLVQVGIRSMDICEVEIMDESKTFFAHDISNSDSWIQEVLNLCTQEVYLTIDLDGLDPSILPSTGTPEPGGLGWADVMALIKALTKRKLLVGMDIVELCPNEADKSSDFLAAKLLYKTLSFQFA